MIRANFHASGKGPEDSDKLKSLVKLGNITSTVPLNILAEIPSGLVNFDGSSWTIKS